MKSNASMEAILAAAREMFTGDDYASVSLRAIARAAGVDPALVIRYFQSKEELYLRVIDVPSSFEIALAGPRQSLGRSLVDAILALDDSVVRRWVYLIRSCATPGIDAHFQRLRREILIDPLERLLRGPDASLRAQIVGIQLFGLFDAMLRGDSGDGTTIRSEAFAGLYARTLQLVIDDQT